MKKIWYAPNKFEAYGEKEIQAVEECLRDGWLAGFGPRSVKFEQKVSNYFGKKLGIFVNSGSSACLLAIAGLDLPKGCKIITPACTFSTTLAPIIQTRLEPVFCDVMKDKFVPSLDHVITLITEDTKIEQKKTIKSSNPKFLYMIKSIVLNAPSFLLVNFS